MLRMARENMKKSGVVSFDEFAKVKGTFVMALPAGQGVIQELA